MQRVAIAVGVILGTVLAVIAVGGSGNRPSQARAADACTPPTKLGVVFILDNSGSMGSTDPERLRATAAGVGLDQMPDGAQAAVSGFDNFGAEILPPTELHGDRGILKQKILSGTFDGGGTDYEQAFLEAQRQLDALSPDVDKRAVVFLSDGEPNTTSYTADRQIADDGTPIYTIGFGSAPGAELNAIAARSGGQSFLVRSAGDAQYAFARVISLLTCDAEKTTDTFDLDPGETKTVDFDVDPSDEEFRALAAWSGGGVDVSLQRPDGSTLKPGTELSGETFVAGDTYANARGFEPAPGQWRVKLTASAANIDSVSVSIGVWRRPITHAPRSAALIYPENGNELEDQQVEYSWKTVRGASNYDLYVDDSLAMTTGLGETRTVVPTSPGDHTWRVQARNRFGASMSEKWTLHVKAGATAQGASAPDSDIELLRKFAPNIFFHHDEKYHPLDVNWFLKSGQVHGCVPNGNKSCAKKVKIGGPADLFSSGATSLTFNTEQRGGPTAIYGHADQVSPGKHRYRILDYWWFYRNNIFKEGVADTHAGDWEGMFVAVPNVASPKYMAYVGIAAHNNTYRYLRDALRCATPGASSEHDVHEVGCKGRLRVNAYPAFGSHATYPRRCEKGWKKLRGTCRQTAMKLKGVTVRLPESDFDGEQPWDGNNDLDQTVHLFPTGPKTWNSWRGRWSHPDQPKVQSPAQQKRYSKPFEVLRCSDRWSDGDSDGSDNNVKNCPAASVASVTGTDDTCDPWFGPMVAATVCDSKRLSAALDEGEVEINGSAELTLEGRDGANAPGLAQLVGPPLAPGESMIVSGSADPDATLSVTAASGDATTTAQYRGLGIENGGRVEVTALLSKGVLSLRAVSGGRVLQPSRVVRRSDAAPQAARNLQAKRAGKRVTVTFRGQGAWAVVKVSGTGVRTTRVRLAGRGSKRRVTLLAPVNPRTVAVSLISPDGVTSAARTARVHRR